MEDQKVTPKVIAVVWKHWRKAFKKNKTMLIGTVLFYSLSMYIDLMFRPTQWKNVFDSLVNNTSPWDAFRLIIIASVIGWIMPRLGEACIVISESKIIKDLKDYCLEGLLGKSTHFFTTHSSGGLVAKSKRFASVSETVIDEFVFSIIRSIFLVIYLVIYSWILIPELTFVFVIWIVLFVLVTIVLSRIRMKFDLRSSNADSVTTSHISDILLSVFTLRVFSAIPRVRKTFKAVTEDEFVKRKTAWFFGNLQWSIQGIFVVVIELYCMNLIINKVENNVYTIGTAVLVQSYIVSLSMYMWGLGRSLIKVRTAFADAYEMAELLDEAPSEPIEYKDESKLPNGNGITFSNVTFGYSNGVQALQNFSFNFVAGRKYGLIGKTGSGKSTLTKLILRAYSKYEGVIQVCDESIDSINKLMLRSWISYVPQDPQFPSWTIREIIRMGKPSATDEEIRSAAEKASCDFIWEKFPLGFDTKVGERGIKLSGGERQRLAIAAAILKDAPIVIMDEPTSALDAETEESIQIAIKKHFEGKTLIVIAHRLATTAILDEIILLENGKVKDFGPHESLLLTSDDYKKIWELQTNPQII
jgi:ATP-binding cassette subfamily B protein